MLQKLSYVAGLAAAGLLGFAIFIAAFKWLAVYYAEKGAPLPDAMTIGDETISSMFPNVDYLFFGAIVCWAIHYITKR